MRRATVPQGGIINRRLKKTLEKDYVTLCLRAFQEMDETSIPTLKKSSCTFGQAIGCLVTAIWWRPDKPGRTMSTTSKAITPNAETFLKAYRTITIEDGDDGESGEITDDLIQAFKRFGKHDELLSDDLRAALIRMEESCMRTSTKRRLEAAGLHELTDVLAGVVTASLEVTKQGDLRYFTCDAPPGDIVLTIANNDHILRTADEDIVWAAAASSNAPLTPAGLADCIVEIHLRGDDGQISKDKKQFANVMSIELKTWHTTVENQDDYPPVGEKRSLKLSYGCRQESKKISKMGVIPSKSVKEKALSPLTQVIEEIITHKVSLHLSTNLTETTPYRYIGNGRLQRGRSVLHGGVDKTERVPLFVLVMGGIMLHLDSFAKHGDLTFPYPVPSIDELHLANVTSPNLAEES